MFVRLFGVNLPFYLVSNFWISRSWFGERYVVVNLSFDLENMLSKLWPCFLLIICRLTCDNSMPNWLCETVVTRVKSDPTIPNRYLQGETSRRRRKPQNPSRVSSSSPAIPSVRSASSGLGALEVWRTTVTCRRGVFVLNLVCFLVSFFGIVRRQLHPKVRIRYFPFYPRSGGASSGDGGRVELCAQ
jgi:hypothetical protein